MAANDSPTSDLQKPSSYLTIPSQPEGTDGGVPTRGN
ncbi:MAG: hypothetical protein QOG21_1933, partial [Actinomycetota bacterium]|nr:hypothetical protein [Actinomycetota bacterium]